MSKRSEEAALKAYPKKDYNKEPNYLHTCDSEMLDIVYRDVFILGYKQAEKDTIERAIDWLNGHSNDYIFRDVYMGKEELKISSQMFDDLKKAMEDEK